MSTKMKIARAVSRADMTALLCMLVFDASLDQIQDRDWPSRDL